MSGLLSDESAVINKVITSFVLLTSEYYQLGLHLNQIKSYIQYFENYEDISLNSLYEYCKLQNKTPSSHNNSQKKFMIMKSDM